RRVRLPPPSPPGGQRSAADAGGLETPLTRTGAALALFGFTRAPPLLARRFPRPGRCPFRLRGLAGLVALRLQDRFVTVSLPLDHCGVRMFGLRWGSLVRIVTSPWTAKEAYRGNYP